MTGEYGKKHSGVNNTMEPKAKLILYLQCKVENVEFIKKISLVNLNRASAHTYKACYPWTLLKVSLNFKKSTINNYFQLTML